MTFVFFSLFVLTAWKCDLFDKIAVKLGYKEEVPADYWAVYSWTNCIQKLDLKADATFFGHSQVRDSDFNDRFPDKSIVNLGYSGDNLDGMLRRIEMVRATNPNKIFFLGGINSVKMKSSEFCTKYESVIDSLLTIVPGDSLFIHSILPVAKSKEDQCAPNSVIVERNKLIKEIANNKRCVFVDLHKIYSEQDTLPSRYTIDGVHLMQESYELWANEISKYMQ